MYVIGTAGHVDHGKSTLVKALTGIDPDRLKEEKEREMTIDLGFAWLKLPTGDEVGVIDVPGHERLVKNMLAGVGGIDLALLVVAADEGVMPQTREHMAILDLLQVKSAVVALTKKDLVDNDWIELVTSDVNEALAGASLAGAPVVPVSSTTGEGLDRLKQLVAERLARTEPRKDLGRPRLPIDRAFVISGFGTVVTGTLVDGSLRVGQEIEIVPKGIRGRIRGLQTHQKKIEEASPGRRLAVNVSGINHEDLERGDVLATAGWLGATGALDARLRLVKHAPGPLKHNASVIFYAGTSEAPARVRLLDADEIAPGEAGWVQLKLERPVAIARGDLFILRNSWGTIGGGQVVEPNAKRHRRRSEDTLQRLEVLRAGSAEEVVLEALVVAEPCPARSLVAATNRSWNDVRPALEALTNSGAVLVLSPGVLDESAVLFSAGGFSNLSARVRHMLAEFHGRFPMRRGIAKEEVRSRLNLQPPIFALVLERLKAGGVLAEEGPMVRLPGHRPTLSQDQQRQIDVYLMALSASPYSPPGDAQIDPELLSFLIEEQKVVKASADVIFTAEAYREMADRVVQRIKQQGKVTLAEVRDMLGTSRKYVQALLEYLDQQRVTRRIGDERLLR